MAISVVHAEELQEGVLEARAARKLSFYVEEPGVKDKAERFLRAFAAILQYTDYRSLLDAFASSAARCSRCTVTCQVYQASGDPRDIPCHRTHLLLDVYKRHFTMGGAFRSHLDRNGQLTDDRVDEMAELFYRCNACRRCSFECPMGLDHGLMTRLGRYILSMAGIAPKALQVSVREQLEGETRNTSKVPQAALRSTLEFLSEEFREIAGIDLAFPLDEKNRRYIFFCAVSDYLMEPDTLMGNAAVLHAAGDWDSWTIGTQYFDGINYGLFYSDWYLERIAKQLVAEVQRLQAQQILIGECGHASRAARDFVPLFGGSHPPPVQNFMEYTAACLESGKIRLTPGVVKERVTYHDPCNVARSGWIVDQPRRILKSFVDDFVEMTPGGRMNYCCGGGGGLVSMAETQPFRMDVAGRTKAEQIKATGADIVVAPCANCKKQLKELVEHYELPCRVLGLHDLVLQVIELPGGTSAAERYERARAQAE
jgi:Fe-S oxidoreductase